MFSNLKIIDISTVLAGPSVGTFFAELGAKVIKVENPAVPDVTRSWKLAQEDKNSNVSAYFSSINFCKEYIKLDLKSEEDYATFLEMIAETDILLSNFKHGDEEKLLIQDEVLRNINPKLIRGKINGFGSENDRVAYDLILQAETGFMSMNGTPESGPVKMPVAMIDVLAGHHLREGILVALLERYTSGKGKTVSVSLYDAAISSLVNQASNFLMVNKIPQRIGSLHPNIAPYGEIFKTKDENLITFAIGSDKHFQKLCEFLNVSSLLQDERFNTNISRVKNRSTLQEILQDKIKDLDATFILNQMAKENVPAGKIRDLKEVFEDENANKMIREELIDGIHTKRVTSIAFRWE